MGRWRVATLDATATGGRALNDADLPAAATRAASYAQWSKDLAAHVYETDRATVRVCDALKACSHLDEAEGDFRARLTLSVREQRDAKVQALRAQYAPKLQAAQQALARAQDRVQREQAQLTQQKLQTAISVGATVLGALFGRKAINATSISRATTAIRGASRIGAEAADTARANESAEQVQQRIADLSKECDDAVAQLEKSLDVSTLPLHEEQVPPRKSDIGVGKVVLLWQPWRTGADGFPAPAA